MSEQPAVPFADVPERDLIDDLAVVGKPKRGEIRFWTTREQRVLREHYSKVGVKGCLTLLPGRTAGSIYQQAIKLQISPPRVSKHDFRATKWGSSPQIDAVITRCYLATPTRGQVKDLARTLGRPRWWVAKRAQRLGLVAPRFKEKNWTDEELELAAANAHKTPISIQRILKRRGFTRSATAIMVRLKRLGPTGRAVDPDHYSTGILAKLFGLDPKVIYNHVVSGRLQADRRGTKRSQSGHDEWKIHRRAVRKFVIENVASVDFRKVDKFWLVDLLTDRRAEG